MAHSEIDAIRTLLGSKPRPVGWSERRERLDVPHRRLVGPVGPEQFVHHRRVQDVRTADARLRLSYNKRGRRWMLEGLEAA